MSLFSSFFGPNINELAAQARDTPGSIVIDVRTPDEYREGHIEGALSVPLVSVPATATHDEIARHLGSAREAVSRMLKYFAREGLVRLSRGAVEIVDARRLRQLTA